MGGPDFILDDDPNGAVVSEVIDVPVGFEGRDVALVGKDENWITLGGLILATVELQALKRLTCSRLGKTRHSCTRESFC